MTKKKTNQNRVVVGLGKTGISCVKHLLGQGYPVVVMDTRKNPPGLEELTANFPDVPVVLGGLSEKYLNEAAEIVLSPGLSQNLPEFTQAKAQGIPIIGDFELFARAAKAPICTVTGSNAKSTVTTLVGEMAIAAAMKVRVGGNLGTPVLDLLKSHEPDLYVLEMSSFQLETTYSLRAAAAAILNISPDHMDRYGRMENYIAAKQRIYENAEIIVFNRQDPLTQPKNHSAAIQLSFGLDAPAGFNMGLVNTTSGWYLTFGDEELISVSELIIKGQHNWMNALAALALGYAMKIPMVSMLAALRNFKGLPHRCEWVAKTRGVDWYNDSKGTNVGATLAAMSGLAAESRGKIILLLGGQGKGQDFSPLIESINRYVKEIILFGEDAEKINNAIASSVNSKITFIKDFAEVIQQAYRTALPGDIVLLSPACASFDMFQDYQHRGNVFKQLVTQLPEAKN